MLKPVLSGYKIKAGSNLIYINVVDYFCQMLKLVLAIYPYFISDPSIFQPVSSIKLGTQMLLNDL